MDGKRNNGFTLIELLAVIVILAIIALIAVPVIINIINKANKSAFKDTAYGIVNAGEYYFAERQLDLDGNDEDVVVDLANNSEIEIKGEVPDGDIAITKDGRIALAVYNDRYCAIKDYNDSEVKVSENLTDCTLPKRLKEIVTTTAEVTSIPSCIAEGSKCEPGTKLSLKVNETDIYDFYILNDNGDKAILIMDENLGSNVAWYGDSFNSTYGPVTALNSLKERTDNWTNILEREYTYTDEGGGNEYSDITMKMKARMLTYKEALNLGCKVYVSDGTAANSCPSWLYENLESVDKNTTSGYWLPAFSVQYSGAETINFNGDIYSRNFNYDGLYGIRPTIEISK